MNKVKFPALIGDSPLAILAAIGTTRLIYDFADDEARLAWDATDHCPILFSAIPTVEAVADELYKIIKNIPADVAVPSGPVGFPPPGRSPDKLRVEQGDLPDLVSSLVSEKSDSEKATVRAWLGSLITDLTVDSKKRGSISNFIASSGGQSIATMLKNTLTVVKKNPDSLLQALVKWRRSQKECTGEYLDHRAVWKAIEDGAGVPKMRGVPGATWLALMSYPLWITTATGKHAHTSGWHLISKPRGSAKELRLPLWEEPIGPAAIKALVEHPALDADMMESLSQEVRLLGVFHICRARRLGGDHSAGVLAPVIR